MKRTVANTMYVIFFGAFVLLFLYKMYIRNNASVGNTELINYLMGGFILAAFFVRMSLRFFPNWYREKSPEDE